MSAELKRRLLQGGWITGSSGVGWSGGSRYYAIIQAAFTDLDAVAAEHIYNALEVLFCFIVCFFKNILNINSVGLCY